MIAQLVQSTPPAALREETDSAGVCSGHATHTPHTGKGGGIGHCRCTCVRSSPNCATAQCVGSNCTRAVCRRGDRCRVQTLHGYSPAHCTDCACLALECLRRPEVSPLYGSTCSNISDKARCLEVAATCSWGIVQSGAVFTPGVEVSADIPPIQRGALLSKVLIKPPVLPAGHRPHVSISCSENAGYVQHRSYSSQLFKCTCCSRRVGREQPQACGSRGGIEKA